MATLLASGTLVVAVTILWAPPATATGSVVVKLQLAPAVTPGKWSGHFVAVTATGRVVDRGTVTEVRYTNGALWRIRRHLMGRRGNLKIQVEGTSLAALTWTIVSGTKAYAGVHAHGREADRQQRQAIAERMFAFPLR